MRLIRTYGVIVATALLGGLTLTGCGQGADQDSPYQGTYRSTYEIPSLNQTGTFSYTVEQKGGMKGSFTDAASGRSIPFDGKIENSGKFNGTATDGTDRYSTSGTFSSGGQTPGGNFQQVRSGVTYAGSFLISDTGIEPGAGNAFLGAYRGTYGMPERSESGNISFTVSRTGDVIGFISQSNNSPVGTIQGTIDSLGIFDCTVSYQPGLADPYKVSRVFKGKLATSKVDPGVTAGDFQMLITTNSTPGAVQTANTPGNFEVTIGSPELNSEYQGSYASNAHYRDPADPSKNKDTYGYVLLGNPNGLPQFGDISITVDKQGDFVGTWGNTPATGRITNDGRFTATFGGFQASGKLSKQQVPFRYNTEGTDITFSAGIAGNFVVRVDGVDYSGNFFGAGGLIQQ